MFEFNSTSPKLSHSFMLNCIVHAGLLFPDGIRSRVIITTTPCIKSLTILLALRCIAILESLLSFLISPKSFKVFRCCTISVRYVSSESTILLVTLLQDFWINTVGISKTVLWLSLYSYIIIDILLNHGKHPCCVIVHTYGRYNTHYINYNNYVTYIIVIT